MAIIPQRGPQIYQYEYTKIDIKTIRLIVSESLGLLVLQFMLKDIYRYMNPKAYSAPQSWHTKHQGYVVSGLITTKRCTLRVFLSLDKTKRTSSPTIYVGRNFSLDEP